MLRLDLEVVGLPELGAEAVEILIGDFDHSPTGLADEVVVGLLSKVVHGGAVPEVDVIDRAKAPEVVEDAVHGRFVHVRLAGLDRSEELFGGRVVGVFDEGFNDGPPGAGHPASAGSQLVQDRFNLIR